MLGKLSNLSCYFEVELSFSDLYLFHFIVLLNPVFKCSKNCMSFSFDKITIGTNNFTSVVLNVAFYGLSIS